LIDRKIKAKEDEQQLKLLKEQYLDFDGDDDGRRIKISKGNKNELFRFRKFVENFQFRLMMMKKNMILIIIAK
jgi:hypothetical protein